MLKNLSRRVVKKIRNAPKALLKYLFLQLFLTLCSWPLLLAWGLPLSYASILGNLIFTPFLTLFLLFSSLIFFCELVYLPSSFFAFLLEITSSCWTKLLLISSRSWLFAYPLPSIFFSFLITLGAGTLLHYTCRSQLKKSAALLVLLVFVSLLLKIPSQYEGTFTVPCFEGEVTIIQKGSTALLIDPGIMGRRVSASSWVLYTLIPLLYKNGIRTIDSICAKPSTTTFRALTALVDTMPVKHVYLPRWKGRLKNSGWAAWEKLLSTSLKYGTKLTQVEELVTITLGKRTLELFAQDKITKKNMMHYKALYTRSL